MKTLTIVVLAALGLGGCVAVPYDAGYYDGPAYYGPAYYGPSIGVGIGVYGGHRHRHHRRHW